MAKKILGIDIGYNQMKLAFCQGNRVLKTVTVPMPENLLREGKVTSPEAMAELLKNALKEHKIHTNMAALVLPNETAFVKNVEMPMMSADQLMYNLPFEFNDYITGEIKDYVFDYAVLSSEKKEQPVEPKPEGENAEEGGGEAPKTLELLAAGCRRDVLEDAQFFLRKAGMRLEIAAPEVCAFVELIRARKDFLSKIAEELCILDMGYSSIRMLMFKGERHVATRTLETGMVNLDNVLADVYSVDVHLAHTYLLTNYENCQFREECMAAYESISVELMRALNFYRFSNRDSTLSDMWLCGGGAAIAPLRDSLRDMLDIEIHGAEELVAGGESIEDCNSFLQAIGITMEDTRRK